MRLSATLAMRYSDFSDRLSTPTAASSRNNVFAVHRKGLLTVDMFVMDSDACEGMFGIKTNISRFIWTIWQRYMVINNTLKKESSKVYQNLWRTLYMRKKTVFNEGKYSITSSFYSTGPVARQRQDLLSTETISIKDWSVFYWNFKSNPILLNWGCKCAFWILNENNIQINGKTTRPCTANSITRTCRGVLRSPRVSKLIVVELSEKNSGLLSTSIRDW